MHRRAASVVDLTRWIVDSPVGLIEHY